MFPQITALSNPARILFLGLLLTASLSAFPQDDRQEGAQRTCAKQPSLVGPCFDVHGRLTLYNGNPSARIWKVGTNRLIGVSQSRCQKPECPQMPKELENKLSWDRVIFGDFLVCPFTESKPGHMQFVCIEFAKNLVVRERR
jgi:hypothetical protein